MTADWYRNSGKRILDLIIVLPLLVLLLPMLMVTALMVRLRLGKPVIFRQQRPGLNARPFTIFKFRSMTNACGGDGNLLPDMDRLTPFGRFLRSTSIDELPELFNVLSGEMSLIGPRPLLMQYLERYTIEQRRRHELKPGITGWAQVNGRANTTYEERFVMDVWYVDHLSLWLDFKIIVKTAWTVLLREGISKHGYATGPEFMGTQERLEHA